MGASSKIYKLDAGGPSVAPSYLNDLSLDGADGTGVYGLAIDPVGGYGKHEPRGTSAMDGSILGPDVRS